MTINNLNDYRRSKVIVKDLTKCLELVNNALKEMKNYGKYVPIKSVLYELLDSKAFIEIHLKKHNEVVKNKGLLKDLTCESELEKNKE